MDREQDSVTLLENRVELLEKQIFGKTSDLEENQTIIDILLSTNAMVATALTRRDKITNVLSQLPQLNEYLDPLYSENKLEIQNRRQYIIELYPQLKQLDECIQKFTQLKDYVDSPNMEKVTSLESKLNLLVQENSSIYLESHMNSQEVINVLKQYNEIIMSLKVLFMDLDKGLCILEEKANKKPVLE